MNLFLSLAIGTVARSLILAALCALAVWLLRSHPARLRFSLWKVTLLYLFALPVLLMLTPPLPKPARPLAHIELSHIPITVVRTAAAAQTIQTPQPSPRNAALIGFIICIAVTSLLLARLAYNLLQLQCLARQSGSITDAHFLEIANELWLESGAHYKPRFMVSQQVAVPVTFTTLNDAWILLPPTWPAWEPAKIKAALTHELAHVQRGDSNTLLLASLATCLFWFHPLSWFLQRQLGRLAEEACDEAVLATAASPAQYAQFLIAFSQDVQASRGRLALPATAVVRKPNLHHRLERLFVQTRTLQTWLTPALVTLFLGTFYLTAATRLNTPQESTLNALQPWPDWERFVAFSPTDIAKLQAAIAANPEDLLSRLELMVYFAHEGQEQPFLEQNLWLIQNHPELKNFAEAYWLFPHDAPLSESARNQMRDAWEQAVRDNPTSQQVILNAASLVERKDPRRGMALLRQAQALSSENRSSINGEIALLYTAAEMKVAGSPFMMNNIQMSPETAAVLHTELAALQDADILARVSQFLPMPIPDDGSHLNQRAAALLERANQIDPAHRQQRTEMQLAFSQTNEAMRATQPSDPSASHIRISPNDSEANLISRVAPVYPEAAHAAHIQGVVEFKATVGTNGHITNLELLRGHPALVNAAKDAVLQWIYHPATQNGTPIEFETQILVSFTLSN